MEKIAVVRSGVTPSEVSGTPSEIIKQGVAIRKNENPPDPADEKRLAQQLGTLYNSGRDACEHKD